MWLLSPFIRAVMTHSTTDPEHNVTRDPREP